MKKLKTAVLGLGRIGWQYHIPQILKHEQFELVAVVDPLEERRNEAATEFRTKTYPSLSALLEKETLDLVVIASPTRFHAEQSIQAMENGCDIFCDKPIAFDLAETDKMVDAMNRLNRKLMVYQPHRATSLMVSLRNILEQNLIGPVYMLKRMMSMYTRRNDWQAFRKNGGGMLSNYGAHAMDQLLYLTGYQQLRKISCELRTIASLGDADDVVKAVLVNQDNTIMDLDINMATAHSTRNWQVFGKYGTIIDVDKSWHVRYYNPTELEELHIQDGLAAEKRRYGSGENIPWQDKIVSFDEYKSVDFYEKIYDYLVLDKEPFVPVTQTRELMRIMEECRKDNDAIRN